MMDAKATVSFACQRCLQPLRLDTSFNHLGEHTLAELSLPIHQHSVGDLEHHSDSLEQLAPPFRLTESANGSNGFMLVGDSGETECLSHHLRVRATLFDILSSSSSADHPLCDECTDSLLMLMDQQLRLTEGEWSDYNEYLKRLESEQVQLDDDLELNNLVKELHDIKAEEERMIGELEALQREEAATRTAIAEQERERERLQGEEERYWKEYSRHRRDMMFAEDEFRSLENQVAYAASQLERLKKTNVFNATFHIWHSGHFGTINSFRLGRLPSAPVDWSEINAAWGQTTLLLTALARKMNLTFQRFRLVPFGNHSYIEVLDQHRELPLYGSGGFKFLWDTKFDAAMVAFLDCLQQFKEEVEKGDSGFCLPYRMDRGKIEDSATGNSYSIKIQFNSEEQWTKALKFLLTNLKWGLAWVSSQFTKDEAEH
ncbi:beclin-1-like protein isoform X2 [Neodiprion pinetum]|uniref:Beclin-1-like protein isoform X1 n=1 Tax=Neodiprion lecontei TaxID=441921 RepID=A0A6J0BVD4_NEOLC|nr:beclin-1-like protein isoform X1 [Neodiprion lecontei]XP_046470641.1 beclin-1-like protein isoform X1 [Neodiprion pinetum]